MNCPSCAEEIPAGRTFCAHCGTYLSLGDEEVQGHMADEVRQEAQAAFVRRTGAWLATSLAVLAAAFVFRSMYRERDIPAFLEAPVLDWTSLEADRTLPASSIPALALPVPGEGP